MKKQVLPKELFEQIDAFMDAYTAFLTE